MSQLGDPNPSRSTSETELLHDFITCQHLAFTLQVRIFTPHERRMKNTGVHHKKGRIRLDKIWQQNY